MAGGIDRSGQSMDVLFKDGNYAEFSAAMTQPDITGNDVRQESGYDSGVSYDNVAGDFPSLGFAGKYDVNDRFSVAIIGAEDYGSDVEYDDATGSMLGGTSAKADTFALSFIGRFKLNENFGVHGGLRVDRAKGAISLGGLAYGGQTQTDAFGTILSATQLSDLTGGTVSSNAVSGYDVELGSDIGYGYLLGASYERPDLALRVAVTYFSEVSHDFDTTETFDTVAGTQTFEGKTKVNAPQSVNIQFQTGLAREGILANTLLFGSFRWADWSEFIIEPTEFTNATGSSLVTLKDSYTYEIGLARQLSEKWAGSIAYIYEPERDDDLVSPLAPTNGLHAVAIGAQYRATESIEIAAGMRYNWMGDSRPETGTPDTARADFSDNTVMSVGLRIGYYF